ncbi:MAG: tetratricopeptide repeat protein [Candidatus Hydrogenedentes bacterium]|nr:tetratricopeptide repeat protein [Candidatus Hydrogenedentota bacterium]
MEQASLDALESILAKEIWTAEDHQSLLNELFATSNASRTFRRKLAEMESQNPDPKGAAAMKIGIARYMLCRFEGALEALSDATDNKDRRYFAGQCYRSLRKYDNAVEEFERAKSRGWEGAEVDVLIIETHALAGRIEEAKKAYSTVSQRLGDSGDSYYLRGLLEEMKGRGDLAVEFYEKAREVRPAHPEATFRLAYYLDLHGEEEEALELYSECVSRPPIYANALLNQAVLHEDAGRYDKAVACLRRLLATFPNHARARLFLRDAEASLSMFYDEDQVRRIAKRNAVLDIPVTDFELSVRARNCLKKMNIMTLGDLVRTTEIELLGYKNFGETSLKEIKEMLAAKGLRLGQAREETDEFSALSMSSDEDEVQKADSSAMSIPIGQIEFSVRVRRVLEQLNLQTLGDLASKTEVDLMNQKNFGQTSLNEIRQRLSEHGLYFRGSE